MKKFITVLLLVVLSAFVVVPATPAFAGGASFGKLVGAATIGGFLAIIGVRVVDSVSGHGHDHHPVVTGHGPVIVIEQSPVIVYEGCLGRDEVKYITIYPYPGIGVGRVVAYAVACDGTKVYVPLPH